METYKYDYRERLEEELKKRQAKSQLYSLRAFGRDLGVHPSTLSLILKGKRRLPLKNLDMVIHELHLSSIEESLFRESFYKVKVKLDELELNQESMKQFILDERYFHIIAEWEHYAVISLIECRDFENDTFYISKKLGIDETRAQVVLKNLFEAKLIEQKNGSLYLTEGRLKTTEDIASKALKASHLEGLNIAKLKLEEIPVEFRDFSSMTVAVDKNKIQDAKTIIREFRQKMMTLLRDGEKQDVYQLSIQLFPLTVLKKEIN